MTRSTLIDMTSSTPHTQQSHGKRLDIQGLRALAVLAVVANHLVGFPVGGFVGVDIFFVVSGFVITSGLLREHEEFGRVSFKNFYFRRAARILPASILALTTTVAVGYLAFFVERAGSVLQDGVWALLFAANWRFAINGTDYWAEDTPISPLQHYWSLGVEEQFYFVWPLVLVIIMGFAASFKATYLAQRHTLAGVLTGLIFVSFIWAVLETRNNAQWGYYSTGSRVWELGVGALLAAVSPTFFKVGTRLRLLLGWVGTAGILTSIAIIGKSLAFPAPLSALPVISTALVIAAGTGDRVPSTRLKLLTNPATVYIGNASYSLYLWHFPVIIFMGSLWPGQNLMYYPVLLLVMSFLAVASYEFVEMPAQRELTRLRNEGFWERPHRRARRRHERSRKTYLGLSALTVATAVVVPLSLNNGIPVEVSHVSVPADGVKPSSTPVAETNATRLAAGIDTALAATAWPVLTPSLDNLDSGFPEEDAAGCSDNDLLKPRCFFDNGRASTAVVFGDSTGVTLLPTVRAALGDQYNVRGLTHPGCIVLDLDFIEDRQGFADECDAFRAAAIEEINRLKPAVVFLTNTAEALMRLSSGSTEAVAGPEWRSGTVSTLESLKPSGARLVVVTAPPAGKPLAKCATRTSAPRACVYEIPLSFHVTATAMSEATKAVEAGFIDTRGWFCGSSGYCPSFVDGVVVKRDAVHTTKQYAAVLAPVFRDAFSGLAPN